MIEHRCAVCGKPASFGYGCNLLADPPRLGTWYCAEHRPGQPAPPAVEPGPAPKKPTQGKLL